MIIRHIPMQSAKQSRFSELVKYITDEQNKQERVGKVSLSNCHSVELAWAIQEVLAVQARNQRASGDKTYHLLISFPSGETPTEDILEAIEDRVVSSVGFKEHQRVSAIHHDTDNLHIHIAINKIHPKSFNMIEPYRAYKTFGEIATKLEIEYGLEITNHQPRKSRSENLADNMELHSGIESLINWMKRNCSMQIDVANSWDELHETLAHHGLKIRIRGNGFVFYNENGLTVKASSVSRSFSKKNLEAKLGEFEPSPFSTEIPKQNIYHCEPLNKKVIGSKIYERYRHEKEQNKILSSEKFKHLRETKARLIEKAKKRGRIKRAALKLINASKAQKKYLFDQISKTLLNDIEKIHQNYDKERKTLMELYQKKTWADWLRQRAEQGDMDALAALRSRNRKNQGQYTLSGNLSNSTLTNINQLDSVTKEGTEIYKIDKGVIRNDGNAINITKGASLDVLKNALEMAIENYGNCIQVNGSPLFKKIMLQITVQKHIPITFANKDMETQRQILISKQEKHYEQSKQHGANDGRRPSRSHEVAGRDFRESRKQRGIFQRGKPNPFNLRQGPPAQGQNSLRNLPQLPMVQLTRRREVLLQDNAHDKLGGQGLQSNHHVRREVFGIRQGGRNKK